MSETDPFSTIENFGDFPSWRMVPVVLAIGYAAARFESLMSPATHEPSKVARALATASRNEAVIYEHSRTVPERTQTPPKMLQ